MVDGYMYYAHRLAWLYAYGRWPDGQIDHINGERHDNVISNLRECSNSENNQNKSRPQSNNRHGTMGVARNHSRWSARIKHDGKYKYLGTFDTKEQASAAYVKAKKKLHPFWNKEHVA